MSEEPIFNAAPGEKIEDSRSRLSIFFGVIGRKFWKLISINLMFIVFNLPAIIIGFILSVFLMGLFSPAESNGTSADLLTQLMIGTIPTVMFFMVVPTLTTGPAQAGLSYLMRCYTYEMPTFNWSDFKDKMKENMKQGIIVSLINLLILVFLLIDFYLYSRITLTAGLALAVANGLLIIVFIIFLMMSLYLYPMMVTYTLRIRDIYKNAFLFAFARFIPNLAVLIICLLLIIGPTFLVQVTANGLVLLLVYVFYLTFGFSLPGLLINFFINPTIDKYLKKESGDRSQESE